jgi:hypothetical protein
VLAYQTRPSKRSMQDTMRLSISVAILAHYVHKSFLRLSGNFASFIIALILPKSVANALSITPLC